MSNYNLEKQILNKLAQANAINVQSKKLDLDDIDLLTQELKETSSVQTLQKLLSNLNFDMDSLLNEIAIAAIDNISHKKEKKKQLDNNLKAIKKEIGEQTVELYKMNNPDKKHIKSVEMKFPDYGIVSCKLKKALSIEKEKENIVVQSLAQLKKYNCLKIDKKELTSLYSEEEDEKLLDIEGVVAVEEITPSIRLKMVKQEEES